MSIYAEHAIKNYVGNNDYGALLEVDAEYPKKIASKHRDLSFLPETRKINGVKKLVAILEDKERYVVQISPLKQALNHGLKLKKVHRLITFRQEAWLKPYIDMNTKLRANTKSNFQKDLFKPTNNSVFDKTMENVRNHRDIKLVTTNERRKKLVAKSNYHPSKHLSENLMAIEMRKTQVVMNTPISLGQAILHISKTLMYKFWYDYLKPKYVDKIKLSYMDTDSFIVHIGTEDFYIDIDTSAYDKDDNRPLPIGTNKKVIDIFKDELNGKIMTKFCVPRAKTYALKCHNDQEKKKAKGTKKCLIKNDLTFENYKELVLKNKIIMRSQLRFKSDHHNVYTEEVNKIAISSNDNRRLKTLDGITTYTYGTNAFKVCESEMLVKRKHVLIQLYY